jgi:hypothetical protein
MSGIRGEFGEKNWKEKDGIMDDRTKRARTGGGM